MIHYVDSAFANALWTALTEKSTVHIKPRDAGIVAQSLADGWMRLEDLEYFIRDRDYRLTAAFYKLERPNFIAGFGYFPTEIYRRENMSLRPLFAGSSGAALRIADAASLLIDLEAIGFNIDPSPIVDAIVPSLAQKGILTDQEVSVLWYRKQPATHHCFQVRSPKHAAEGAERKSLKLATGHKVEGHLWGDGSVHWFAVAPPKRRTSSRRAA